MGAGCAEVCGSHAPAGVQLLQNGAFKPAAPYLGCERAVLSIHKRVHSLHFGLGCVLDEALLPLFLWLVFFFFLLLRLMHMCTSLPLFPLPPLSTRPLQFVWVGIKFDRERVKQWLQGSTVSILLGLALNEPLNIFGKVCNYLSSKIVEQQLP